MRTRAERRKTNFNKINHKEKTAKSIYGFDYYKYDNQYCKGKIHYSCYLCSVKTNRCGNSHSDRLKIQAMNYKMAEM